MSQSKHILVVEDEEHLAVGLKFNLEGENYQVSVAADGPSALDLVEDSSRPPVDLIILDLMLPGMSGYEVCETLRERNYQMPILMLSARTLTEDRTRGFDVGADQYMMKPFDLEELLSRVKNLLNLSRRREESPREQKVDAPHEIAFGEAQVNFRTFEASVNGKSVRLTQREMSLLEYFADNEGRVIPQEELLENVWRTSSTVATHTVRQFIRRLRKIFEPNPSEPIHFLTLRDAGYRFVAEPEAKEEDA